MSRTSTRTTASIRISCPALITSITSLTSPWNRSRLPRRRTQIPATCYRASTTRKKFARRTIEKKYRTYRRHLFRPPYRRDLERLARWKYLELNRDKKMKRKALYIFFNEHASPNRYVDKMHQNFLFLSPISLFFFKKIKSYTLKNNQCSLERWRSCAINWHFVRWSRHYIEL